MYNIIYSLPLEAYCILMLLLVVGAIYSIFEIKKKRPGHPSIWIFPCSIPMLIATIVNRCSVELTTNILFQRISEIATYVCFAIFILSFVITTCLAYKNGYVNKEKFKNLMPAVILGVIVLLLCFFLLEFK